MAVVELLDQRPGSHNDFLVILLFNRPMNVIGQYSVVEAAEIRYDSGVRIKILSPATVDPTKLGTNTDRGKANSQVISLC